MYYYHNELNVCSDETAFTFGKWEQKNDTRACYILWCNFNKICLNSVEIERMSPPLAAISQAFSKTIDNGKMDGFGGMLLKNLNEVFEQVPCVKTSECTEITSIKLDGPCLIYFSNIIL